jgi:hypothetical protein
MGPLSGVAVAVVFFLYGLTLGGWATISAKVFGVIYIIAAIVILIDCFWFHRTALANLAARRRVVVQQPPQA